MQTLCYLFLGPYSRYWAVGLSERQKARDTCNLAFDAARAEGTLFI